MQGPFFAAGHFFAVDGGLLTAPQIADEDLFPADNHGALLGTHIGMLCPKLAGLLGADHEKIDVNRDRQSPMFPLRNDEIKLHGAPSGRRDDAEFENDVATIYDGNERMVRRI